MPKIPTVVFMANLPAVLPASFTSPCKTLFEKVNSELKFSTKLL